MSYEIILTMDEELQRTPIQEFYNGRSVFVTGATGFCGMALIEKLLRSCPDIDKVYILIRAKNGVSISDRLELLLKEEVFQTIRSMKNSAHTIDKLIGISGDMSDPALGISSNDEEILCNSVSVVFHIAATIKFTENLKIASSINVCGTKSVIELCKKLKYMQALVYMSTAFSNCPQKVIEERIYPPPMKDENLFINIDKLTDLEVKEKEKDYLGAWPNTYSYTKAIAEDTVTKYGSDLPIAILRPSIVLGTWKEPFPGWIKSFGGPIYPTLLLLMGKMHCGHCDPMKKIDSVPVDMVVNALIAIAWKTASSYKNNCTTNKLKTYNLVSSNCVQIRWGEFFERIVEYIHLFPAEQSTWYCFLFKFKYVKLYMIASFFIEFIPSLIMDLILYSMNKKPKNIKYLLQIWVFFKTISYFCTHDWKFHDDNIKSLLNELSPADLKLFDFNVQNVSWPDYIKSYVKGVRTHLLKENPDNIKNARRKYAMLKLLHYSIQCVLLFGAWRLFCRVTSRK